ncbi:hypothetical protein D4R30_00820 [archaeon]|nr:MAG: hypothetical protein D4R30_00820 [archaeon]
MLVAAVGEVLGLVAGAGWAAEEPPSLNPFGKMPSEREDAMPGYLEMSDGSIHYGQLYMTRDKRFQVYDEKAQRQREVPLRVVKQLDCKVKKEWMEKEWKFKELAKDEKMYTGRAYPAREYTHTLTLENGETLEGPLSGIVYVQPPTYSPGHTGGHKPPAEPQRFLLHKRDKGEIATELSSLLYVKSIRLGDEALKEGKQKADRRPAGETKPGKKPATKKAPASRGKGGT